jgi:hypothetical protein
VPPAISVYNRAVLRQGPISQLIHGGIEYAAGALFIAAPFIFAFESGGAIAASIAVGVLLIFIASITRGPTSLIDALPVGAHVLLDYALAVLLVAMPFILGFSGDDPTATAFFIVIGVVHLLITVATRFERPERRAPAA